jgi:hypothetical protein
LGDDRFGILVDQGDVAFARVERGPIQEAALGLESDDLNYIMIERNPL